MTGPRKVRVLIAEDSDAMRTTLETLFALDPRIAVIGSARDGLEVLDKARSLRPDLITMDVVMPGLDGVEATARLMAEMPSRILMISAHTDDRQIDLSFRAIAAGALEVCAKPVSSSPHGLHAWAKKICDTIVLMSEVPVITRSRRAKTVTQERRVDVVGIAASTGGPLAIAHILSQLSADLPVPILVAQHIAEGFTDGLIRWLSNVTKLRVAIAREAEPPRAGHVYFAPDRRDLEVGADGLLHAPASSDRNSPSGDLLLASLTRHYRARVLGIVLTGMGEDGALGLRQVRDTGGVTLAQSQESCVVFGMPNAAVARGATSELRSLDGIAAAIVELSTLPRRV